MERRRESDDKIDNIERDLNHLKEQFELLKEINQGLKGLRIVGHVVAWTAGIVASVYAAYEYIAK